MYGCFPLRKCQQPFCIPPTGDGDGVCHLLCHQWPGALGQKVCGMLSLKEKEAKWKVKRETEKVKRKKR